MKPADFLSASLGLPTRFERLAFASSLLLLAISVTAQTQFSYTNDNGGITITKYIGSDSAVIIPDTIDGLPVPVRPPTPTTMPARRLPLNDAAAQ